MQVDKLKKGSEHIKAPVGGGGKFTPVIYWKEDQETKYLAFITPIEDMYTLDQHTVKTKNGWRSFVCRKNEAFLDESNGECPACDLYNNKPGRKHFALAAELDQVEERVGGRKTVTDLTVKMIEREKDGKTVQYPRIGVVVQSASNFFDYLKGYDAQRADITTLSFEIQRSGQKTNTSYNFFPIPDLRPDLTEFEEDYPSLIDYIAEQGSIERYAEELEGAEVEERKENSLRPTRAVETVIETTEEGAPSQDEASFEALKARLEAASK